MATRSAGSRVGRRSQWRSERQRIPLAGHATPIHSRPLCCCFSASVSVHSSTVLQKDAPHKVREQAKQGDINTHTGLDWAGLR